MEVPRNKLDLKDDPLLLSPPILTKPLYACAKVVNVTGYVPGATLDLEIDGAIAVTAFDGGSPAPSGGRFIYLLRSSWDSKFKFARIACRP
jgi:hypothetical protein